MVQQSAQNDSANALYHKNLMKQIDQYDLQKEVVDHVNGGDKKPKIKKETIVCETREIMTHFIKDITITLDERKETSFKITRKDLFSTWWDKFLEKHRCCKTIWS